MLRKLLAKFLSAIQPSSQNDEDNPVFETTAVISPKFNSELRTKIMQYLPLKDIKNCRLVNITWNLTATPILLKRSCISFHVMNNLRVDHSRRIITPSQKEQRKKYLKEGISAFLNGNPIADVQNLKIRIDQYYEDKSVMKLFKHYNKTLVELDYTLPAFISTEVSAFQFILPRLRSLKKLKLTLIIDHTAPFPSIFPSTLTTITDLTILFGTEFCGDCSSYGLELEDYRYIVMALKNFAQIFPNLESLVLLRTPFQNLVIRFREALLENDTIRNNLRELKKIEIQNEIQVNFENLSKLKFNPSLTSLSVAFGARPPWSTLVQAAKAYETLLWNHAPTLTKLQLRTSSNLGGTNRPVDVILPVMPCLKKLQIFHMDFDLSDGPPLYTFNFKFLNEDDPGVMSQEPKVSTTYLDYSSQFPELTHLSFKVVVGDYMEVNLRSNDPFMKMRPALDTFVPQNQDPPVKCTTVRSLNLIGVGKKDLMEYVSSIEGAFPNVHNRIFNIIRK